MDQKLVENIFFFSLLAVVSYLGWQLLVPFMPALVLASIISTVCYPIYRWIRKKITLKSNVVPALLTTLLVFLLVVGPLGLIGYLIFFEATSFYAAVNAGRVISIAPTLSVFCITCEVHTRTRYEAINHVLRDGKCRGDRNDTASVYCCIKAGCYREYSLPLVF